jgi:phosphoglycolate phosphatase
MTFRADAVLFDKDGTLFDFSATWDTWALQALRHLSQDDQEVLHRLAEVTRYDLSARKFHPDSFVIAGTNREVAERLAQALPHFSVDDIETYIMLSASEAPQAETVPLAPFLSELGAMGLMLGVVTNDSEYGARANLSAAGVEGVFDFIAGFDSGYGAKPAPGPLLAFADAVGCAPSRTVMVGDSLHDLQAGRAAGMLTVGVLTGPARHADLAPLADAVLPDIGHLVGWLRGKPSVYAAEND